MIKSLKCLTKVHPEVIIKRRFENACFKIQKETTFFAALLINIDNLRFFISLHYVSLNVQCKR